MANNETLKDLVVGGHVTEGEVRKVAIALWSQSKLASEAFPAPYSLVLPNFTDLPSHVQGFIVKGLLEAEVVPDLRVKPEEPDMAEQKDGEGETPAEARVMFPADEDVDRDIQF